MSSGWSWRRIGFLLLTVVYLIAVWLGATEGWDGFRDAQSGIQRVAAVLQIFYGLAALATLYAIWTRSSWLGLALLCWVSAITATGALAPVVWGGATWQAGLAGGAITLGVALVVAWATRALSRPR